MSEATIRRKARRQNWTVLDNSVVNDRRIGFDALGVLTYLLSKPDNWTVMPRELERRGGIGPYAIRSILKRLAAAGYATLVPLRGIDGRMLGRCWEISEDPSGGTSPKQQLTELRSNRKSVQPNFDESAPLVSTDLVPSTETTPTTDNVAVVAPRPAPPDHDGDALQDSSADVSAADDQEALDAITEILQANPCRRPDTRARTVLASIVRWAHEADADDIRAAAADWAARMERIKGHTPDPIQASQLPGVVAAYVKARRSASRAGHGLVPVIER